MLRNWSITSDSLSATRDIHEVCSYLVRLVTLIRHTCTFGLLLPALLRWSYQKSSLRYSKRREPSLSYTDSVSRLPLCRVWITPSPTVGTKMTCICFKSQRIYKRMQIFWWWGSYIHAENGWLEKHMQEELLWYYRIRFGKMLDQEHHYFRTSVAADCVENWHIFVCTVANSPWMCCCFPWTFWTTLCTYDLMWSRRCRWHG